MTDKSSFRLDEQLCFAVYSTAHAFNRLYKPKLDALGITYPQFLVLSILWRSEPQTVGSLGELLLLDSSTLTPLLKRLEAAGFVRRTRSTRDERVVDVTLTPEGQSLRDRAWAIPPEIAEATGESMTELGRLRQAILRVRDSLNASSIG
ncbi:MarR family winged helix-turn-helix transcriptional regulator [Aureimonas jatrophae]|jgi:MarR family transcriptional regulator, organic hydroperoxide resistance regulator|uniref:DNA-binding transcriptional regulator, MarR family n=1 Tax=Aureimonas jatrophae TaxID=1166073 RepID=A0A1H0EQS7_9HYPH|nr:MarR family transcriptional regulator [Aureimonas jatrophae]MBB3950362.1 DNA-binding MarR family transcriptional regulator [Aureimonas jatrophae]SDN84720.1 DNA-binding transcriptional regulator, MarR family [Aureimonas jatrophae]